VKLGEMLVSRGLITHEQLNEALFAQQQFGGRVGTLLVEMGMVAEDQLAAALSQQLSVPWVRPQALAAIPRDVIARLPRDLAQKYRVVPIKLDRELHICSADPQNFERLDELRFAVGCPVRAYVVTEVTLNYALERYYGIRREVRPQFATRASGVYDAVGASAPPGSLSPSPDEPSAAPRGLLDQLANVMTDEDVVNALMRYFAETFEHAVILALGDGIAAPVLQARGNRLGRPNGPTVRLAPGSLLNDLVTRAQVVHRAQLNDPELRRLCAALGMPVDLLTLVPVFDDGGRLPYVVIAQGRDEAYLRGAFAGMAGFLKRVANAIRIVALRNGIRAA
jgi:hypothetical protein